MAESNTVPAPAEIGRDRAAAQTLLREYTKSDSLIKHALAVEAAMRFYARFYKEDEELWGVAGLLHDFDYERFPELGPQGHPFAGCRELEKRGYPVELIEAILGHAAFSGVNRETLMAKVLFACDELAGLITAAVFVRPDRSIHTLNASSVIKKMKDKAFARAVNRDDIRQGAGELGIDLAHHIDHVIAAMRAVAGELGLAGSAEPSYE